ncbi:MAG: type II secretion system F family protein [Planctomycetota bacterium]|nr:type II secretion system F family protein [Planctomycetota bacterium]
MAIFEYNALTAAGRLMKGTVEAASPQEAGELLKQMQLTVNSIEKARPPKPVTAIGRNEFLLFNQQLASIAKAGIPLERGLRELAKDVGSARMRRLIENIAGDLEAGVSIEQAFEKRQKHFPALYGRILKAGVETGRLSEMLTSLNRHLELANQTRRIIFEATAYPAVVLALGAIIVTAVFLIIIPQFRSIYADMIEGQRLNPLTSLFFSIAQHIAAFWIAVALIICAGIFIPAMLSTFPLGRRLKESLLLAVPIIGRVYHSSTLARMAEAMAMMVGAGCDMPACLRLSSGATGSGKLILESETLARQVEQGANILEAGQFCRMLPRLFLYSIQLGSQRNELQDNLYSLGQMYAQQARCSQARLQAILLPIMLIAVGGFIAMAVLAMFLPMIQVVSSLSALQ